jgi:hypothetical protein
MTLEHCAICGLFCKACTVYIATKEAPDRLRMLARRFGVTPDEMKCDGCRSERRGSVCRTCEFTTCTQEKGIAFCHDCDAYPCEQLEAFAGRMPHRVELWTDNARIKNAGHETWSKEIAARYSCRACTTINSAYDLRCRKCGGYPASDFAAEHSDVVRKHLEKSAKREG